MKIALLAGGLALAGLVATSGMAQTSADPAPASATPSKPAIESPLPLGFIPGMSEEEVRRHMLAAHHRKGPAAITGTGMIGYGAVKVGRYQAYLVVNLRGSILASVALTFDPALEGKAPSLESLMAVLNEKFGKPDITTAEVVEWSVASPRKFSVRATALPEGKVSISYIDLSVATEPVKDDVDGLKKDL
jgi:hypothetical protein